MSPQETREGIAEAIGTFMLVLVGAGTVAMSPGNVVAAALAHGLILAAIVATYGHISGAHVNPAVTLGLLVGGKVGPRKAVIYWIAQIAGGLLAALVLRIALPSGQAGVNTLGQTVPASGVAPGQLVLIEAIITFFLVSTIYQAAAYGKGGPATPVVIGFTLAACILLAGPLTGGSANLARTLGPALVAKDTQNLGDVLQYAIGILGGGALAGLLHGDLFAVREEAKPAAKKR
ncbi:MAG: aquaporin [Chloroflexi bacterium]|nr:aquaporin [Chloroflexota bacterium]